jgi:hypothetical protein
MRRESIFAFSYNAAVLSAKTHIAFFKKDFGEALPVCWASGAGKMQDFLFGFGSVSYFLLKYNFAQHFSIFITFACSAFREVFQLLEKKVVGRCPFYFKKTLRRYYSCFSENFAMFYESSVCLFFHKIGFLPQNIL